MLDTMWCCQYAQAIEAASMQVWNFKVYNTTIPKYQYKHLLFIKLKRWYLSKFLAAFNPVSVSIILRFCFWQKFWFASNFDILKMNAYHGLVIKYIWHGHVCELVTAVVLHPHCCRFIFDKTERGSIKNVFFGRVNYLCTKINHYNVV